MLNLVEGIYLGEAKEAEGFTGLRITKKLRIGGGAIPEANNFITQSGDTIVTSAGTPLAIDGISSLTTAPSITDAQLTFADDSNSTVSFSMQQLKDYISPAPSGTTLHQYDRVDGKATVAGFWTDGNGQRYAVCVVDAAYRISRAYPNTQWAVSSGDTQLTNYTYWENALNCTESGTWNTDTILNNYTPSNYPAFNAARNATSATIDNKSFLSCLPNAAELQMIWNDRVALDTYDTTLTDYPTMSLSDFNFGGNSAWSSTERNADYAWLIYKNGNDSAEPKTAWSSNGIIPIIEIPVDENGTVITN